MPYMSRPTWSLSRISGNFLNVVVAARTMVANIVSWSDLGVWTPQAFKWGQSLTRNAPFGNRRTEALIQFSFLKNSCGSIANCPR